MPDALVGAHGAAQFGCAGAVVSGLRNEAFPGYGAAGDGEDDEAAVAEALARVAVEGVAVASEEVGARGAGRQGVVGEVEVLRGDEVEGHSQEAAEGKVGEGLLVDEAGDNAVGEVSAGASSRDDEANGAGDALSERQEKGGQAERRKQRRGGDEDSPKPWGCRTGRCEQGTGRPGGARGCG